MRNIVFDIETGAADMDTVLKFLPEIERGKVPANYKDPAKIAEYEAKIEADYQAAKAKAIEKAALSAETGIILAIGWVDFPGQANFLLNESGDIAGEIQLIHKFFMAMEFTRPNLEYTRFVGHNIKGFDIPFILRRAMKAGIMSKRMRNLFFDSKNHLRYAPWVVDTMEEWAMGDRERRISLNNLAKYFGLHEKLGTGDQFAKWFLGGERQKALDYLAQDLMLAGSVGAKMGVVDNAEGNY